MNKFQKASGVIFTFIAAVLMASPAMAQVDTASTSFTNIQSWFMTWIPLAATVAIIGCAIAWMIQLLRMDWAVRIAFGLIVIGSASYLVGLFGLS